jgi:hypothetical protein
MRELEKHNLLSAGSFPLSEKMRIFSQDEGTRKAFTQILLAE